MVFNVTRSEDILGSLFNSNEPFRYWSYYSDYQINDNNSWSISHNVNPFIAFYDGMVSNFLLVILIPIIILLFGVSLTLSSLLVFLGFGALSPSFNLFNRMLGDGREIHKVYKKYGKFLGLLWIVLFFELFYFHQIELVWFISLLAIALVLEFFRIKAIKKIESNTEFYFSISKYNEEKYNEERGHQVFYPQFFMALYIPILLALVLIFIPFSGLDDFSKNIYGYRVFSLIVLLFLPVGFFYWLSFLFSNYDPNYARIHSFNLETQKKWYFPYFLYGNRSDRKASVFDAVKRDGFQLQYASEELKNDKEIVLKAIQSNKEAIQYASEEMQNDPEIIEVLNNEKEQ